MQLSFRLCCTGADSQSHGRSETSAGATAESTTLYKMNVWRVVAHNDAVAKYLRVMLVSCYILAMYVYHSDDLEVNDKGLSPQPQPQPQGTNAEAPPRTPQMEAQVPTGRRVLLSSRDLKIIQNIPTVLCTISMVVQVYFLFMYDPHDPDSFRTFASLQSRDALLKEVVIMGSMHLTLIFMEVWLGSNDVTVKRLQAAFMLVAFFMSWDPYFFRIRRSTCPAS